MKLYLIYRYEQIDWNEVQEQVIYIYKSEKKAKEHLDKLNKEDNVVQGDVKFELEETETDD